MISVGSRSRYSGMVSSKYAVVHLGLEGIDPGLFTTRPVGLVHEGHELDTFLPSET